MAGVLLGALGVLVGYVAVGWWMRRHPSGLPYSMRFFLSFPRRALRRDRLLEALTPQPGERMLEIGPGTGYYTFDVAKCLGSGTIDILDIDQKFLDHVMVGARERELGNITPSTGDARSLPYESDSFDGAFLVSVLGEVPDGDEALRELARVLRPGGRLVVGESLVAGDPHAIVFPALRRRAAQAGLAFERRLGSSLSYFAVFRTAQA